MRARACVDREQPSSVTTAGVANPLLATIELISSVVMTLLSFVVPVLAALLAVVIVVSGLALFRRIRHWLRTHMNAAPTVSDASG